MELRLNSGQVGIAVRFKDAPNVSTKGFGHVDVLLPGGAPVGFYTDDTGPAVTASRASHIYGKGGQSGASSSGLAGLVRDRGHVWDYPQIAAYRPEYVNLSSARAKGCRSTIVVVNTTQTAARIVWAFWNAVSEDKSAIYNLWGGNCSSYAFESFVAADLLPDENLIQHFFDTPNNLYKKVSEINGSQKPISGFVGIVPLGGDKFKIDIQ